MNNQLLLKPTYLYALCVILVFPALLINLGDMPLHTDEPTRAIVALEMMISKNYIVPTINGDFYYNKPGLFNWILIGFYKVFGNNELAARMPTFLSLIGFALTLFIWLRKKLGTQQAFISALVVITGSRMLFYDSLLGLIDVLFSWLTFLLFIVIYEYYEKKDFVRLFLYAYLIMSVGILLKGLPSIAFQGITIGTFFIYKREWKKLFHPMHFVGIALCLLIVGFYFYSYSQHNDLIDFFVRLYTESSQRTALEKTMGDTLLHLIKFPLEGIILQIIPWGILFVTLFQRQLITRYKENKLFVFCALIFLANIIIYWLSPDTRARYLFMLYPLLVIPWVAFYFTSTTWHRKTADIAFGVLLVAITLLFFTLPFIQVPELNYAPNLILTSSTLAIVMSLVTWNFVRNKTHRMISLGAGLLLLRIGFNLIILPIRQETEPIVQYVEWAKEVGKLSKGHELSILHNSYVNHETSYYIEKERNSIVPHDTLGPLPDKYYIASESMLKKYNFDTLYSFRIRWENYERFLVTLKQE